MPKFIDETRIIVKGGSGGNGCFSYLRAKYIAKGPPNGGTGGRGGHIFIEGNPQLHTLQDAAYRKTYRAESGTHGKGSNKDGKNGEDIVIQVPLGTLVYDDTSGGLLADCTNAGQKVIIAKGGKGGRGNAALSSRHNRNPERAEEGKPGQELRLRLELKVLADIGLVGRPNAGKSTLLSRISRAHPRIADYPFTTTHPYLGIIKTSDYDSFVIADIPGLIEGSHTGKGMGIRFLRHIERTKALAILVEAGAENPEAEAEVLLEELRAYDPRMADKPRCYILTKTDLLDSEHRQIPAGWLAISSVTGDGLTELGRHFESMIAENSEDT